VSDYRNCILQIIGSADANLKVFVKGSLGRGTNLFDSPDFDVLPDNRDDASAWDYIEVVDLEDGAAIDGDDGISLSGNYMRLIEVNINSLDYIAIEVTGVIAGTVSVVGSATTNQ
jgi:hypothetical protein